MAVPNFLKSSYYLHHAVGVVDNDIILDHIMTALGSQTPSWTLTDGRASAPATVLAVSPVDADGRFFDILFTVVTGSSNLKMEYRVRDQNGTTVMTRRTGAAAVGLWEVFIFSGQYHFCMDIYYQVAAPEFMAAGILDFSPEAQSANAHYVYCSSSKTSADSLTNNDVSFADMIDNATAGHVARLDTGQGAATSADGEAVESGYRKYIDRAAWCRATGETSIETWAGRMYQTILVGNIASGVGVPARSQITVPIDIGTTGVFQVVGGWVASDNKLSAYRIA